MTLFGKTEEMKNAKIRAFEKKYTKENPEEDKETIHKMAVRKYKHNRRQLMDRAKVAALTMLLTAGVILGAQGIINSSNADTPQINYFFKLLSIDIKKSICYTLLVRYRRDTKEEWIQR